MVVQIGLKKKKGKNGSLVEIVYSLIKIDLESIRSKVKVRMIVI